MAADHRRWLAAGAVVMLVAGCAPDRTAAPQQTAGAPAAASPGTASGQVTPAPPVNLPPPEETISYAPDVSPAPKGSAAPGEQTYAPTGAPAPTAAGPLTQDSLPNPVLGFKGVAKHAEEGEYNANGTWVHAVDGTQASVQALPLCGGGSAPTAAYALAGTYAGPAGEPGNGLILEFADEAQAKQWLGAFTGRLEKCGQQITVRDLKSDATSFTGRRTIATDKLTWSEAGRVKGKRVLLLALAGEALDLDALARALA